MMQMAGNMAPKAQVMGAVQGAVNTAVGTALQMAPGQELMGVKITPHAMILKQHNSECCRCCCCQPEIDWDVHDTQMGDYTKLFKENGKMFMKEEAAYVGRCFSFCMPAIRPTKYTVYEGSEVGGRVVMTHEKGCSCPVNVLVGCTNDAQIRIPCCLCCGELPYLTTKDADGNTLGKSVYVCDEYLCVPKYDVLDANGVQVYHVRPEVCCGGCCVKCISCRGGGHCQRVPFPIRQPKEPFEPIPGATIGDLDSDVTHECCTRQIMYKITYSNDVLMSNNQAIKATLMGTALLVDLTWNEQEQS